MRGGLPDSTTPAAQHDVIAEIHSKGISASEISDKISAIDIPGQKFTFGEVLPQDIFIETATPGLIAGVVTSSDDNISKTHGLADTATVPHGITIPSGGAPVALGSQGAERMTRETAGTVGGLSRRTSSNGSLFEPPPEVRTTNNNLNAFNACTPHQFSCSHLCRCSLRTVQN